MTAATSTIAATTATLMGSMTAAPLAMRLGLLLPMAALATVSAASLVVGASFMAALLVTLAVLSPGLLIACAIRVGLVTCSTGRTTLAAVSGTRAAVWTLGTRPTVLGATARILVRLVFARLAIALGAGRV
jgi:hypothetical protein